MSCTILTSFCVYVHFSLTLTTQIDDRALDFLAQVGVHSSLRYAVQLLTPARIMADTNGRDTIEKDDVKDISELFLDAKASARMLVKDHAKYLQ